MTLDAFKRFSDSLISKILESKAFKKNFIEIHKTYQKWDGIEAIINKEQYFTNFALAYLAFLNEKYFRSKRINRILREGIAIYQQTLGIMGGRFQLEFGNDLYIAFSNWSNYVSNLYKEIGEEVPEKNILGIEKIPAGAPRKAFIQSLTYGLYSLALRNVMKAIQKIELSEEEIKKAKFFLGYLDEAIVSKDEKEFIEALKGGIFLVNSVTGMDVGEEYLKIVRNISRKTKYPLHTSSLLLRYYLTLH